MPGTQRLPRLATEKDSSERPLCRLVSATTSSEQPFLVNERKRAQRKTCAVPARIKRWCSCWGHDGSEGFVAWPQRFSTSPYRSKLFGLGGCQLCESRALAVPPYEPRQRSCALLLGNSKGWIQLGVSALFLRLMKTNQLLLFSHSLSLSLLVSLCYCSSSGEHIHTLTPV